ncbi:glycosyltransferase [Nitrospirillum sp. BR 11163]|uniref:glycosyltransferase n=1 Tax=Nitrospirillum sp. BR 11163 TaxID=3104323 RepID=UPI002AFE3231|nr:glycosyltransferase [Nitrospirillum sp. BR 11163]MEA1673232.1 glycosyltransferase [Nitrospirillum sp. BR 11163]
MQDARAISPRLDSIAPGAARAPDLVCFSHLRWDFVRQRPQHLLSRAARHYRVLFIEEAIFTTDDETALPRMDITPRTDGVSVAVPILPSGLDGDAITFHLSRLTHALLAGRDPSSRVLWYYTPAALDFTGDIPAAVTVYDNMDELSAFLGASHRLLAQENALFAKADLVFTGGMSLYAAKRHRHPAVHAFPSSIDARHFAQARSYDGVEPPDQADIPHPRIGFFGVIDERMDLDLVGRLADLRPDWHFIILGPVVKIDAASLPRRPNLHWLGPKGYDELPRYLAGWDAGFMPFALNEATRFISPTKTPEFLAAGVPLVSTPITDVVTPYGAKDLVKIADDAAAMAIHLDGLLAQPRDLWRAAVKRQLAATSWDKTWAAMRALVEGVATAKARPGRKNPPAAQPARQVFPTAPAEQEPAHV